MQLTILGNSPACPNIGGASAGYLVTAGNTRLVLDFGPGVVATSDFRKALPGLTGIVISHLHTDHWLDLVPLGYLLKVGPNPPRRSRLKVWVPPGTRSHLLGILETLTSGFPLHVYDIKEYDPNKPLRLRGAHVKFQEVKHYVSTYAMRVESGARSLTYSADSTICDSLVSIAQGSDLLLCEATYGTDAPLPTDSRGHLTAKEAGMIASRANVKKLLLTHIWQGYDPEVLIRHAQAAYSGPCQLALSGCTYRL